MTAQWERQLRLAAEARPKWMEEPDPAVAAKYRCICRYCRPEIYPDFRPGK